MQEWDGLRTTKDRVVVIASTNRPFDLDEAVLRRLPRRILVDLPDLATREAVLRVSLARNRLAPDVNLTQVALKLEGYTGSDIKEVCREAVVRISHDAAARLEHATTQTLTQHSRQTSGAGGPGAEGQSGWNEEEEEEGEEEMDAMATGGAGVLSSSGQGGGLLLRAVTRRDLERAMAKLSASVNERGREAGKVAEWNEQYGEIKKKKKAPALSMYL
mmetsp:Transcript_46421/g.104852  ORF Transcript_46421/g.104852 Transcript_46421/m.104852 type:complete len:217 (-) Transcript_46421:445-1095(-)